MVVMGEPIWYEVRWETNRDAAWYGDKDKGNLLFLDGAVQYATIWPRHRVGPAVFEPRVREAEIESPDN
jgi:prepilin-type processing-associated H-X9-DG protein